RDGRGWRVGGERGKPGQATTAGARRQRAEGTPRPARGTGGAGRRAFRTLAVVVLCRPEESSSIASTFRRRTIERHEEITPHHLYLDRRGPRAGDARAAAGGARLRRRDGRARGDPRHLARRPRAGRLPRVAGRGA